MSIVSNNNSLNKLHDISNCSKHSEHADKHCKDDHHIDGDIFCGHSEAKTCPPGFMLFKVVVDGFGNALDYLTGDGPKTLAGFAESLEGLDIEDIAKNSDKETQEALAKFVAGVNELGKCPDRSNVDISEALKGWSEGRDSDCILQILQAIRGGDCSVLNKNPKLKEKLLTDLPRLLEVFNDVKRNGGSPEAVEAAARVVDAELKPVEELADEGEARKNGLVDDKGILTDKGKERVASHLQEATERGKELLEKHSEYISKPMQQQLRLWIQSTIDFIIEFYDDVEKDAEKAKEEKKCKERKESIKKFYIAKSRAKKARLKRLNLKAELKELREKFAALLGRIKRRGANTHGERVLSDKVSSKSQSAQSQLRKELLYSEEKCELLHEMPTGTHCEEGSFHIDFNLIR